MQPFAPLACPGLGAPQRQGVSAIRSAGDFREQQCFVGRVDDAGKPAAAFPAFEAAAFESATVDPGRAASPERQRRIAPRTRECVRRRYRAWFKSAHVIDLITVTASVWRHTDGGSLYTPMRANNAGKQCVEFYRVADLQRRGSTPAPAGGDAADFHPWPCIGRGAVVAICACAIKVCTRATKAGSR